MNMALLKKKVTLLSVFILGVLDIGIPETVVALGGQYYYKNHGDMPDVFKCCI